MRAALANLLERAHAYDGQLANFLALNEVFIWNELFHFPTPDRSIR